MTAAEMNAKLDALRALVDNNEIRGFVIVALPRLGGTVQTPSVICESACDHDDVIAMYGALRFAFVSSGWGEPARYDLDSWTRERGGFP